MTMPLGVLGLTGLTAYFWPARKLVSPNRGQNVCRVLGQPGQTGSVAGQIAKIKGCRVIGIAGGPEKCAWLTNDAHFDAAIDYKSEGRGRPAAGNCAPMASTSSLIMLEARF